MKNIYFYFFYSKMTLRFQKKSNKRKEFKFNPDFNLFYSCRFIISFFSSQYSFILS